MLKRYLQRRENEVVINTVIQNEGGLIKFRFWKEMWKFDENEQGKI